MLQELSTRLGSQQNNLDKDSSSVKSSGSAGSRHTGSPKSPGSRNTGSLKDPGNKSDTKPPKPPKPPKPSKPLPVTRSKSQEPEKIDSIDNDMSTATKDNRKGKKGGMFKKVKNMFKRKGSGKENSEPILKSSRAKSESDLTMADDKEQLDLHGSSSVLDQNDANADPSARNAKNKVNKYKNT